MNDAAPPFSLDPPPPEARSLPDGVTRDFLVYHRLCPGQPSTDGVLPVATEPNSRLEGLAELALAYGCAVAPEATTGRDVELRIERLTSSTGGRPPGEAGAVDASDLDDLVNQPPVVRYVNVLIRDAYDGGASDVHIEAARGDGVEVRYRVDGVLQPALEPPPGLARAVVSRIKLLADLDIAERRRPQDGRIRLRLESIELDLRVSTAPSIFGESVVLRLLDRGSGPGTLRDLGLPGDLLESLASLATRPHGMILVTGPTGSGKTTTLYAALGLRDRRREKIITLEEPVEHPLDGVVQVPVHRQTGVTFASMLRSILRQDPDVMMVGEMRDAETAELAVQAALTGHVLFSTLHTRDALGAVPRLLDLGVPAFLIASTLEGVLAQRLVRRNCVACSEPYEPESSLVEVLGGTVDGARRGRGCGECRGSGYRGRVGIFELLVLTPELRTAVAAGASEHHIASLAREAGMRTLRSDGLEKVRLGLTTVEEVFRVTQQ